jgi:hypothetical protein
MRTSRMASRSIMPARRNLGTGPSVTRRGAAKARVLKEGGFLGFGAERVNAGERQMLDQVPSALGMA